MNTGTVIDERGKDMPLIKVQASVDIPEDKKKALLSDLSRMTAKTIGKPEQYVMAIVEHSAVWLGGKDAPAVFAEVRSIGGLNGSVNENIARELCELLKARLGISPDRVYINFIDVPASAWGWNASTFG